MGKEPGLGPAFPILRGPLFGKRWLLNTRSNFFFGTYEPEQTRAFVEVIKPGDVIYDVGAHVGYYTVLGAVRTGAGGRVVAFEPAPRNLAKLQAHVAMNRLANVTIREVAVSDRQGTARFDSSAGSGVGHLSETGAIQVPTTTLDALAAELPPPRVLKIDVEGAELAALNGGQQLIRSARPVIFLSTHGQALKDQCMDFLRRFGYKFRPVGNRDDLVVIPPTQF